MPNSDVSISEHYRDMVESSSDGVFTLRGFNISYLNPAFARSLGHDRDLLLGKDIRNFIQATDRQRFSEEVGRLQATIGMRDTIEVSIKYNNRSVLLQIALRSATVRREHHIVANARDITADRELKRQLESQVPQTAAPKEHLNIAVLSSGMAHDILNGLSLIERQISTLLIRQPEVKPALSNVGSTLSDLTYLCRRLQNLSGQSTPSASMPMSIAEMLAPVVTQLKASLPGNISLEADLDGTQNVRARAPEIREVVNNLALNAVDAMDGGGVLRLLTQKVDGEISLYIEDTGPGIPQDRASDIFRPFYTTKGSGGTGLGLAMSKWLCIENQVELQFDPSYRFGARFILRFDRQSATLPKQSISLASIKRVLIVDDDDGVRNFVKDVFQTVGFEVLDASHPSDALKLSHEHDIHLVLTDLDLPGLSGWRLAKQIKSLQPKVLVGLMTGWNITMSQEELQKRGVDFALNKPFEIEDIEVALMSLPTSR